jgi:hypothetical protein
MSIVKISVALAGIIAASAASVSLAATTQTGVTQSQAVGGISFYMGGSSAAVSGFGSAVGADLCVAGSLTTWVTSPSTQPSNGANTAPKTPDFRVFSCNTKPGKVFTNSTTITIYYRAEAGSVVGAFAPLNNVQVNQLNLSAALCLPDLSSNNQFDCATSNNPGGVTGANGTNSVVGDSPDNGPFDSYSGAVARHALEYGISDVEPGALGNPLGEAWAGGGNDDPLYAFSTAPYTYTFLGTDATPDTLQAMPHTLLFQQSFGFVASKNLGLTNLTTAEVASILAGTVTDWKNVINPSTNLPVTSVSTPIVVCHRDLGSGTRTAADIIFEKSGCDQPGATVALADNQTVPDSFSTGDVLACVQGQNAGFGYVSIDNNSKAGSGAYTNVTALQLDGRTPSATLTAEGGWDYAVEASANKNSHISFNSNQTAFYGYLIPALQALATAPQSKQVNALPGVGGNVKNNGTLQTSGVINVTSVYRSNTTGNSCNPLLQQ